MGVIENYFSKLEWNIQMIKKLFLFWLIFMLPAIASSFQTKVVCLLDKLQGNSYKVVGQIYRGVELNTLTNKLKYQPNTRYFLLYQESGRNLSIKFNNDNSFFPSNEIAAQGELGTDQYGKDWIIFSNNVDCSANN